MLRIQIAGVDIQRSVVMRPGFGVRIARVAIGVVAQREAAVGAFDLALGRVGLDAQRFVRGHAEFF